MVRANAVSDNEYKAASQGGGSSGLMPSLTGRDDPSVRSMLQATLEHDGDEVVAVPNARDALRCIAAEDFEAVLPTCMCQKRVSFG